MSVMRCGELTKDAIRLWGEDLDEISRASLQVLLNTFEKTSIAQQEFRDQCFLRISRELYDYYDSVFSLALLKLSIAIEDKVSKEGAIDGRIKDIISMFSEDEKNAVKEFERFKSLDPNVVSSKDLAEYIVSKREGIYNLVKEAVNKQYIYFDKLIESWSKTYKISNTVRRGLLIKYQARFKNIVEAVKILVDQQSAWLRRLFSDYEDALLSSSEVREHFESKAREVFENEVRRLRSYIEKLEEEKSKLLDKIDEISRKASKIEVEKTVIESELTRVRQELESVRTRYEEVLRGWEKGLNELESLRKKLAEKERELEELAERERESVAGREALEAEILRLRQLVESYEARVREYEYEKERLQLDLRVAEEKLHEIEESIRGRSEGRLVFGEEAVILEHMFIEKLRSKLSDLPLVLKAPWGEEKINKWSDERIYYENSENIHRVPRNTKAMFVYEKRGFLSFGESRRIEIRGIYTSDLGSIKKKGYTDRKASLSDLVKAISEISIVEGKTFVLVGMASPAGWDERAIKYVTSSEGPILLTRNMVVFLVDPVENKVYYPEHLSGTYPYIEQYARLFMVEVDIEEESRVEKAIRDLCDEAKAISPIEPVFPYSRIHERLKLISWLSLIRVISRLRDKKIIEIKKGEKENLVICRGLK